MGVARGRGVDEGRREMVMEGAGGRVTRAAVGRRGEGRAGGSESVAPPNTKAMVVAAGGARGSVWLTSSRCGEAASVLAIGWSQ